MTAKNVVYAFYQKQPDITITLTLYCQREEATRRTFYLRNLSGQPEAGQVAEATRIMNEVAEELHYLTGFGVDKGVVKLNGKKAEEVVYPEYGTEFPFFYDGAIFKFRPFQGYAWVNGDKISWQRYEHLLDDTWQVDIVSLKADASFRLPCVLINQQRRHLLSPEEIEFFGFFPSYGRRDKQREKILAYDKEDPIFRRFVRRFYEDGHLCFGEKRVFASERGSLSIQRCKWPKSKAKPKKGPRRSVLASQPTDDTEYVYIIRMGRTKHYKIGKSNDPQGRLASLQTASPYKLKLLHTFKADNATAAEESLHAALHDQRMEGEWFKLSDEQHKALVSATEFRAGGFVIAGEIVTAERLLKT